MQLFLPAELQAALACLLSCLKNILCTVFMHMSQDGPKMFCILRMLLGRHPFTY